MLLLRTSEPSLSTPMPTSHGRGCGRGHGGGRATACATLNLEEVLPAGELHGEEPILEELGVA